MQSFCSKCLHRTVKVRPIKRFVPNAALATEESISSVQEKVRSGTTGSDSHSWCVTPTPAALADNTSACVARVSAYMSKLDQLFSTPNTFVRTMNYSPYDKLDRKMFPFKRLRWRSSIDGGGEADQCFRVVTAMIRRAR